mmetsp:Transcript_5083/g.14248  ORF Transcript_5083/g.14248 Transcript_5083/m.14248 type:complete len:436 (-) Transcript_5083:48-1355(-)
MQSRQFLLCVTCIFLFHTLFLSASAYRVQQYQTCKGDPRKCELHSCYEKAIYEWQDAKEYYSHLSSNVLKYLANAEELASDNPAVIAYNSANSIASAWKNVETSFSRLHETQFAQSQPWQMYATHLDRLRCQQYDIPFKTGANLLQRTARSRSQCDLGNTVEYYTSDFNIEHPLLKDQKPTKKSFSLAELSALFGMEEGYVTLPEYAIKLSSGLDILQKFSAIELSPYAEREVVKKLAKLEDQLLQEVSEKVFGFGIVERSQMQETGMKKQIDKLVKTCCGMVGNYDEVNFNMKYVVEVDPSDRNDVIDMLRSNKPQLEIAIGGKIIENYANLLGDEDFLDVEKYASVNAISSVPHLIEMEFGIHLPFSDEVKNLLVEQGLTRKTIEFLIKAPEKIEDQFLSKLYFVGATSSLSENWCSKEKEPETLIEECEASS